MNNYRIALCSVFWNENDINNRYFDSVASQTAYFDSLTEGKFSPLVNFNMGNAIQTRVCYKDTSGRSIEELITCNYAVVEKYNDVGEVIGRRYFFAYPEQDSGTQLFVTLSLDHIQTNFIRYQNQIAPCMIRRCHLNRWVEVENNRVKFNTDLNSPFYEESSTGESAKRLISRRQIRFNWTGDDLVDQWLYDNVAYWVYIFTDGTKDWNVSTTTGKDATLPGWQTRLHTGFKNSTSITQDYGVWCYPVYKNNFAKIQGRASNTEVFEISSEGERYLRLSNNDSSFYFSKKISIIPPFYDASNLKVGTNLSIDVSSSNTNAYLNDSEGQTQCGLVRQRQGSSNTKAGLFTYVYQRKLTYEANISLKDINTMIDFDFDKSAVNDDWNYNPKRLAFENMKLTLRGFDGNSFDYDIFKIGTNLITFEYTETLQPEITKYYCRLKPTGLYSTGGDFEGTNKNYTGLVGSVDTSIAVTNDQYAQFLANNKNFWLQTAFKMTVGGGDTIARGAIGGSTAGLIGGVASAVVSAGATLADKALTVDNLRQSPDSLTNASGNILFNGQIDNIGFYIEINECLPIVQLSTNDYNKQFGYEYNRIDYLTNCVNIREMYNYIEADLNIINAPLNNLEKQALRELFKGIRFWNIDENVGNYIALNNKERSLSNG